MGAMSKLLARASKNVGRTAVISNKQAFRCAAKRQRRWAPVHGGGSRGANARMFMPLS
mgnify:CR=1 FL=1